MARKYLSFNPYTQTLMKEYKFSTSGEISEAISRAHTGFKNFSQYSYKKRAERLINLGNSLNLNKQELATMMASEMGKPINFCLGEIAKSVECCNYYAMHSENLLKPHNYPVGSDCYVRYDPMGVIFLIMPFNFPVWMPLKTSIPHLMAGNTILLKHCESTPQTAEILERCTKEAGLVDEFINIRPDIPDIEKIIRDPKISGVSLTGSVRAGKAVGAIAAANMKKAVLELGGSDPFIVLVDADLPKAAKLLVSGRLHNSGQVCISPKRAIVVSDVYDEFVSLVQAEAANYIIGNPLDEKTLLGPMARADLCEQAYKQVKDSVELGAKVILGGRPTDSFNFPATILVNITENMPAFKEEIFGPVISIIKAKNEQEAIRLANNTEYGLGATIISKNVNRVKNEIVPHIQSGMVFVNENPRSIVQVPFGGHKSSGIGRELGENGIKEFCNAKTVYIA